jgi:hypothetical protein
MEGRDEFERRFALYPEKPDGCLTSTEEITAAIIEAGGQPQTRIETGQMKISRGKEVPATRAAKKDDLIEQLLLIKPDALIWSRIEAEYMAENEGKMFITADQLLRIEKAGRMIEDDPNLRKAFSGGYAEVSLFWRCPKTGVPMKARADYLKVKALVDLKSYANQQGLTPERAIGKAIASNRYALQPSVYYEGVAEVRRMVREGSGTVKVCGDHTPAETEAMMEWALRWAAHDERAEPTQFLFVFQMTGKAPITRGLWWPRAGTHKIVADNIVEQSKRKFRLAAEQFGTDTWLDIAPIYDLNDDDVPGYWADI